MFFSSKTAFELLVKVFVLSTIQITLQLISICLFNYYTCPNIQYNLTLQLIISEQETDKITSFFLSYQVPSAPAVKLFNRKCRVRARFFKKYVKLFQSSSYYFKKGQEYQFYLPISKQFFSIFMHSFNFNNSLNFKSKLNHQYSYNLKISFMNEPHLLQLQLQKMYSQLAEASSQSEKPQDSSANHLSSKDGKKQQMKQKLFKIAIDRIPVQKMSLQNRRFLETKFSNVIWLVIKNCGLRTMQNFPTLETLRYLDVSRNQLLGSFQYIVKNTNITYMDVSHNYISYFQRFLPLRICKRLRLFMKFNPILKKDKKQVRKLNKFFKDFNIVSLQNRIAHASQEKNEEKIQEVDSDQEKSRSDSQDKQPKEKNSKKKTKKQPKKLKKRSSSQSDSELNQIENQEYSSPSDSQIDKTKYQVLLSQFLSTNAFPGKSLDEVKKIAKEACQDLDQQCWVELGPLNQERENQQNYGENQIRYGIAGFGQNAEEEVDHRLERENSFSSSSELEENYE